MGNSNIQEAGIGEDELELYKHSSFYGRHELRDGKVIKKYELPESENEAFLGLIQSYQKTEHTSLINIENVRLVTTEDHKYHYQICFPYYPQTLASELMARKRPYNEKEVAKVILDVGEGIRIFTKKLFPYGYLSPEKIVAREFHQGYCIGIDILMNPQSASQIFKKNSISQQFLSPEAQQSEIFQKGFDRNKCAVYSLGIIALKCVGQHLKMEVEQTVFDLRRTFSFQFCNLLEAMLQPQNRQRISLEECLDACREIYEQEDTGQLAERIFIRGFNCVKSMWLFDHPHESAQKTRWRERCIRR